MRKKEIKTIAYKEGNEKQIISLLNKSKEPILIKMENFIKKFYVQFFIDHHQSTTSFTAFENNICKDYGYAKFTDVMTRIKKNQHVRIFGEVILGKKVRDEIESHIPLWRKIPTRTRGFTDITKIFFFFGGAKTNTNIHYDRELC